MSTDRLARCTGLANDLDGPADPRNHYLTDELIASFPDGRTLWDEYGIDDNIVVSHSGHQLIQTYPD